MLTIFRSGTQQASCLVSYSTSIQMQGHEYHRGSGNCRLSFKSLQVVCIFLILAVYCDLVSVTAEITWVFLLGEATFPKYLKRPSLVFQFQFSAIVRFTSGCLGEAIKKQNGCCLFVSVCLYFFACIYHDFLTKGLLFCLLLQIPILLMDQVHMYITLYVIFLS